MGDSSKEVCHNGSLPDFRPCCHSKTIIAGLTCTVVWKPSNAKSATAVPMCAAMSSMLVAKGSIIISTRRIGALIGWRTIRYGSHG